uniref:Uncharacterized protein n=1 Tax=Romanomermis culicivorax TaxID=13658 RepID=A0A915L811_ROMCU
MSIRGKEFFGKNYHLRNQRLIEVEYAICQDDNAKKNLRNSGNSDKFVDRNFKSLLLLESRRPSDGIAYLFENEFANPMIAIRLIYPQKEFEFRA